MLCIKENLMEEFFKTLMQSINAKNIGIKVDLKMVAKMEKEYFFIK